LATVAGNATVSINGAAACPVSTIEFSSLIEGNLHDVTPANVRVSQYSSATCHVAVVAVPVHVASLFCPLLHFCHTSPVVASVTVPSPLSVYDAAYNGNAINRMMNDFFMFYLFIEIFYFK
jgi:hypothetical protein